MIYGNIISCLVNSIAATTLQPGEAIASMFEKNQR
jgi:hypothetical protein